MLAVIEKKGRLLVMQSQITLELIGQRLARTLPHFPDNFCERKPAAVALILQESGMGLELFFIERAHHPGDPWSGNIGFPGGRMDRQDSDLRRTAERETCEEVGIDLHTARYLGRLSDVVGANLPVRVACFVYALQRPVTPVLSSEVHDAFWYRYDQLWEPERQLLATVQFGGRPLRSPAIRLDPQRPVLWGITYRLVGQFRQIVEGETNEPAPLEVSL